MTENKKEYTFKRFDKVEVVGRLGEGEIIGFPEDIGGHKQVTVWYPDGGPGERLVSTALSLLVLAEKGTETEPKSKPELMRVPV